MPIALWISFLPIRLQRAPCEARNESSHRYYGDCCYLGSLSAWDGFECNIVPAVGDLITSLRAVQSETPNSLSQFPCNIISLIFALITAGSWELDFLIFVVDCWLWFTDRIWGVGSGSTVKKLKLELVMPQISLPYTTIAKRRWRRWGRGDR